MIIPRAKKRTFALIQRLQITNEQIDTVVNFINGNNDYELISISQKTNMQEEQKDCKGNVFLDKCTDNVF